MNRKKILVTGGSGFIGTRLCQDLLSTGHQVIILDLAPTRIQHPDLIRIEGDIRKPADVADTLTTEIDAIYHFAAIVSVPECELNPEKSFETNLQGTQNILNRLKELKPKRSIPLFFASSAAVYGGLGKAGYRLKETENLPEPTSFYGLHKFAAEKSLRLYCKTFGLHGLSFRFFNVFGPGQNPNSPYSGVITIFEEAFRTGTGIKLYNHGNNSRDFIHVSEISRACSLALNLSHDQLDGRSINLCSGQATTIRELYEKMAARSGKTLSVSSLPAREGDIEYSCGDPDEAMGLLSFRCHSIGPLPEP
jgi:UDP-glucose 4-epimerase